MVLGGDTSTFNKLFAINDIITTEEVLTCITILCNNSVIQVRFIS